MVFEYINGVLEYIVVVGALTSFFAATTGLLQNDLKRVIAYSTCSQLGYMVFACGLSNYSVGFFHLTNHAFLCAVLVHILFHEIAFVVVKRSAYVVIRWAFKVRVELNWTVKIKYIGFIWGWLAKSDNIIAIKLKNICSVKELCFKLLENQRLTTQELLWIYIVKNCDICRRRPCFCYFFKLFFIKDPCEKFVWRNKIKHFDCNVFWKSKCDGLSNKQTKFSSRRYFFSDLRSLRIEIQMLVKNIHIKLLGSLDSNKNFVKENFGSIQKAVRLQQKLLSLGCIKYGMYDAKTVSLANNYLCSLTFRLHAVLKLLKTSGFKIYGTNNQSLKQIELRKWVELLSYSNVFKYKVGQVKKVFISKGKSFKSLQILTKTNRLIQTLFVLTYEPIIEAASDFYSFGFRESRNAHQAIGVLFSKLQDLSKKQQLVCSSTYVLNYSVCKFFESVSHSWLIKMFPAHAKHKLLLKVWLEVIARLKKVKFSKIEGVFCRSSVAFLLINFTLNGLENVAKPKKMAYWSETDKKSFFKKKIIEKCCFVVKNFIVRYAENFIVLTNYKNEVSKITLKIQNFLYARGFEKSLIKRRVFQFSKGETFDFLGFTFKFIKWSKPTRVTKKVEANKSFVKFKNGLFIYVSNNSVKNLKNKVDGVLKNLNWPPSQIILKLNFILKEWASYFGVESYETLRKIDRYIFKKCFKFFSSKFDKVDKYIIFAKFFPYLVNNISFGKLFENASIVPVALIRICSIVKCISILKFCPYSKELTNPFIYFEAKDQWFLRIFRLRYRVIYLSIKKHN